MLLITHTDLDGVMCAILYKLAFGRESPVEYVDYDKISDVILVAISPDIPVYDVSESLHITDISPQGELKDAALAALDRVVRDGSRRVQLFDHHVTSLPMKEYRDWVHHRMDVCGAKGYYDWLLERDYITGSPALERLIDLTDIRDRWIVSDPLFDKSKDLNSLLHFFGRDTFVNRCIKFLPFDVLVEHEDIIKAMRSREKAAIDQVLKPEYVISGTDSQNRNVAFFVTSGANASEACHQLLESDKSFDYAVAINPQYDKIDLRSREDGPDVSKIAQSFNGGGHPHAAGFILHLKNLLTTFVQESFSCSTKEQKILELSKPASES